MDLELKEQARPLPAAGGGRWEVLAGKVRAFQPSVVVLIARKAPRIVQALGLDFGPSVLVISDLAIPFCGTELKGARVAVIDDIVNVGSTLSRAMDAVLGAGAVQARAFAIAERSTAARLGDLGDLILADPGPLDPPTRDSLTAEIPDRLQQLGLPYDLDFPVLDCRTQAGEETFARLRDALAERHGEDQVYDLTTPPGAEAGIRRLTVDLSAPGRVPTKVRVYLHCESGRCSLAPIRLASPLATDAPEGRAARRFWAALDTEGVDAEARGRLRLFLDSLSTGLSFVSLHADLFSCDLEAPLLPGQTELIFGPRAIGAATFAGGAPGSWERAGLDSDPARGAEEERDGGVSAFLEAAEETGLMSAVAARVEGEPDELSVFIAFFNTLAEWVGANDPSAFRLEGPVSRSAVEEAPYLRLRIGPTFADLAGIVAALVPDLSSEESWRIVSRLLDRFIDDGGVVPTIGTYDGRLYRIYRKGERDPRDRASLRTRRAWEASGKALSLTRASKLLTILAYSEDTDATDVKVKTLERGNVFCHAGTVLHEETEIAHRLRRTGQLEEARDEN